MQRTILGSFQPDNIPYSPISVYLLSRQKIHTGPTVNSANSVFMHHLHQENRSEFKVLLHRCCSPAKYFECSEHKPCHYYTWKAHLESILDLRDTRVRLEA
jgi:hypothetical protein